jgi:protein phosphatase
VLKQYYVSVADNNEIGIFQGVRGSFLGIKLQREIEGSCPPAKPGCELITVFDLKQGARDNVRNGIAGLQSKQEAEAVIERLRNDQALPVCTTPTPTPTASTTNPTATSPATGTVHPTTKPIPTPTGVPLGGLPFTGGTTSAAPVTTTTTHTLTPGVDCRKAGN